MRACLKVVVCLVLMSVCAGAEKGYWQLGWGIYGAENDLDMARYDWSMINFGNVPADERTVARCNRILALNPQHKFFLRVWSIGGGQGSRPENRHQTNLFDYYYKDGARARLLAETERQVRLICEGVDVPESVAAICFLEELPGHISSNPWRWWRKGDDLPWEMAPYAEEIAAELGETPDFSTKPHRMWWGQKYVQLLEEVHRTIKEASGGRDVYYWQATAWYTIDHLAEGQDVMDLGILPITYGQILKEGVCDGIFGYPNNDYVWERQTLSLVEKYDCLMFSQLSTPAGMRLERWNPTVERARWEDPRNVGTFVYMSAGSGTKAWNDMPWMDGIEYWSIAEQARKIGWNREIGIDVIRRQLAPQIALDYSLEGKRPGDWVHVYCQVWNPRNASWFGGDADAAQLTDVQLDLTLPDGFEAPPTNSAPLTMQIADVPPGDARYGDWWLRITGDGTIPEGQAFAVTAAAQDTMPAAFRSNTTDHAVPAFQPHEIRDDGDSWIEPAYRVRDLARPALIETLGTPIVFPQLSCGNDTCTWRDTLLPDVRLLLGPGRRARLLRVPLLDDATRTFAKQAGDDGVATFTDGYMVYQTRPIAVRPNANYTVRLTGRATDGAISHLICFWEGKQGGEAVKESKSCFFKQLGEDEKTVEATVQSPAADTLNLRLRIYRHEQQGALHLREVDLVYADIPAEGLDVTDKLDGALPEFRRPFTVWRYADASNPNRYGRPSATVRFLPPGGEAEYVETRQGATDF